MPILKTNILGSEIEINYQEGEKDKLINLIDNFNKRLSKYEKLNNKFTSNKIIFLAALMSEDENLELNKKISSLDEKLKKFNFRDQQEDHQIREIVLLKDKISVLEKRNNDFKEKDKIIMNEIKKVNNKLILLIEKILSKSNEKK